MNESKRRYTFLNIKQSYGSPKINNARRKYLPESFIYEVLFELESDDRKEIDQILGEKEIYYINEYNSIKFGYNHQPGGLNKTNIISAESRRKGALKTSKAIIQYSISGEFIKEWLSTMDIERELGIHHTLISSNCLEKTKHCRDFIFKYKTGENIIKFIEPLDSKLNKTRRLSISQYDKFGNKLNTWNSISEASRVLEIDRHTLKKYAESEKEYKEFIYIINNNYETLSF